MIVTKVFFSGSEELQSACRIQSKRLTESQSSLIYTKSTGNEWERICEDFTRFENACIKYC